MDDSKNSPFKKKIEYSKYKQTLQQFRQQPHCKQRNSMITLLKYSMAGPCEDQIDLCIKQMRMQTNPWGCVELHGEDLNKNTFKFQ